MFDGIISRVIQHNDHIEGKLFTDKLSSFKRKIIEKKLMKISKGNISTSYSMKFLKVKTQNNISRLLKIMDKLRLNCPWDRKQTLDSLRD